MSRSLRGRKAKGMARPRATRYARAISSESEPHIGDLKEEPYGGLPGAERCGELSALYQHG